jgi:predicted MFS family arabinose efflux permease
VALGAFIIVTTEFIPVGLLPLMACSLYVPLGLAGLICWWPPGWPPAGLARPAGW